MNAYYIAEGEQVTGPFVEDQLMNMWRLGQITANAQVCLEGTEEWVPIRTEIHTIEAFRPMNQSHRKLTPESALQAVLNQQTKAMQAKSAGAAVLLSVLLPGLGHLYAGEVAAGLLGLLIVPLFGLALISAGLWPLALVIYAVLLVDSANAVKRCNAKL
jgi:TM2 domain-containing membrane protein YozV